MLKKEIGLPIVEVSDKSAKIHGSDILFTGMFDDWIDLIFLENRFKIITVGFIKCIIVNVFITYTWLSFTY